MSFRTQRVLIVLASIRLLLPLWICPDIAIFDRVKGTVTNINEGYPSMTFTRRLLDFGAASQ